MGLVAVSFFQPMLSLCHELHFWMPIRRICRSDSNVKIGLCPVCESLVLVNGGESLLRQIGSGEC